MYYILISNSIYLLIYYRFQFALDSTRWRVLKNVVTLVTSSIPKVSRHGTWEVPLPTNTFPCNTTQKCYVTDSVSTRCGRDYSRHVSVALFPAASQEGGMCSVRPFSKTRMSCHKRGAARLLQGDMCFTGTDVTEYWYCWPNRWIQMSVNVTAR